MTVGLVRLPGTGERDAMADSLPAPPMTFTARTTEDVLALVPIVLGFFPTDSLVLLTFSRATNMPVGMPAGGLRGEFNARADLPADVRDVPAVIEPIRQAVHTHRPQLGAVVVYSADVELGRVAGATAARLLEPERIELLEVVQVDGTQWWELPRTVRAPRRWRPERHEADITAHPMLAERIFAGHVVLQSRQALVDSLRGSDPVDAAAVSAAVVLAAERLAGHLDGWAAAEVSTSEARWLQHRLMGGGPLSVEDVGRVLALTQMSSVRERVCRQLTRHVALAQLPVWREVVHRAPPVVVGEAAAVLALVAWLAGDGALAWCAVDRCQEVDPDNGLAHQMALALQHAVPPSAWDLAGRAS
ncbi:DUF4192 domain-containing protein [Nocardioides mangrovicus]|uniref:DUF4192 domain-containing protein n=1 Tax=Nocardioides mangrovicus TaxID=2478913 RepID=UPI00131494CF|nr:DUF4192 domain-containing protein [Nocardioides mangrovicus]